MRDTTRYLFVRAHRRGVAAAEIVSAGIAVTLVGGVAAVIVPMSLQASDDPPDAEAEEVIPSDKSLAEPILEVREFVRSGGALVNTNASSALFWYRDEDDRGIMNVDELVLLSFQGTVGAFMVSRVESDNEASPRVQLDRVMGPGFASRWAFRSDVVTDVLAGGFDAVRIETTRDRPGATTLIFRFNWANRGADADGGESGFRVTLPSVRGDGAARRGEIE